MPREMNQYFSSPFFLQGYRPTGLKKKRDRQGSFPLAFLLLFHKSKIEE